MTAAAAQARLQSLRARLAAVTAAADPGRAGKVAARAHGQAIARALGAPARQRFAATLAARGAALAAALDAGLVALYAPIGAEVDSAPLANALLADGRSICYPRLLAGPGEMVFGRAAGPTALRARPRSRILEPEGPAVAATEIDLFIVPALAATPTLVRLGRGGGYYDRYLPQRRPDAALVLVCPAEAIWPWTIVEAHDVAADAVITERGEAGPAA